MSKEGQRTLREIGNFEIISKIGQGGMGTVFKARQKSLDREVALKVLPPSIAKDASFIERFQREARASAKLNHPHIVSGIDVGQDPATGLWYFAMEFVDGPTLKKVMKEHGRLSEEAIIKLGLQIGSALECLDSNGMIHRDIKPDNIMLNKDGEAKLADLGLAKDLRDDASLTQSGRAMGTPFYMSPEQVRGENDTLDIRADIYAFGATLYHLATGMTPFQGETSAVIMSKHLTEKPPLASRVVPEISEGLSRLIEKAMQKNREERFQKPSELIAAFRKVEAGEYAVSTTTTGPRSPVRGTGPRSSVRGRSSTPAEKAPEHSPMPLVLGIAALGAIVIVGFLFLGKKPVETTRNETSVPNARPKDVSPSATSKGSETPVRSAPLEEMLRSVQEWEQRNPDAYDELDRRYGLVTQAARGTHLQAQMNEKVAAALTALQARQTAAVATAWQPIEEQIKKAVEGGDYDSALAFCEKLPDASSVLLKETAAEKVQALGAEAEAKIAAAVKQIEERSAAAEPAEGLKLLSDTEKIHFAPTKEALSALRNRLEGELADAGELEKKRTHLAAEKKLEEHLSRFDTALLEKNDLAAAKEVAAVAQSDTALKPQCEEHAGALSEILKVLEDVQKQEVVVLKGLEGKELSVGKDKGVVKKAEGGVITLSISLEGPAGKATAQKMVKVADLSAEQRNAIFKSVMLPDSAAGKIASAIMQLQQAGSDLANAEELLKSIPDFALTPHYTELVRSRRLGAAEVAAEKSWPALELVAKAPCVEPEQGKALLTTLSDWSAAYGTTKFSASKVELLNEWTEKATRATIINLFANGDFESGKLDGWRGKLKRAAVVDGGHESAKALEISGDTSAQYPLTLEPGVRYEVSAWIHTPVEAAGSVTVDAPDLAGRPQAGFSFNLSAVKSPEWQKKSFVFTAVQSDHLLTVSDGPHGHYRLLIDDLCVAKASVMTVSGVTKQGPVTADKVVVWNMHNGVHNDRGTTKVNVTLMNGDTVVYAAKDLKMPWEPDKDLALEVAIPSKPFTAVRVEVIEFRANGGGLSEVQVMKGRTNLALGRPVSSSGKHPSEVHPGAETLTDGVTTSAEYGIGYWALPNNTPGWAEVSFTETSVSGETAAKPKKPVDVGEGKALALVEAPNLLPDFHFYNGHVYRIFKEQVTWAEAKRTCEKMNGHLAIVESEREDEFLKGIIRATNKNFWIGLFDNGRGQWTWVDEKQLQYIGFSERSLSSKLKGPRTALYAQYFKYAWAEEAPDRLNGFLCEWDVVEPRFVAPGAPVAVAAAKPKQPVDMRDAKANAEDWSGRLLDGQPGGKAWPTQVRPAADNINASYFSSFPLGETYTGIFRSPEFNAPTVLRFYLCGHNSEPGTDPRKNLVRLRDAASNEALAQAAPPQSDTARQVSWDLAKLQGRKVFIELVDGDNAGAYAWIAAGRFEPAVVPQPLGDAAPSIAIKPAPGPKAAVPDDTSQAVALKAIKELYKEEYQKKGLGERSELARTLLAFATEKRNDAAAYYVALSEASVAAVSAGDVEAAIAATDLLSSNFVLNTFDLKVGMLAGVTRYVTTPESSRLVANEALELGDNAVTADNYDVAVRALALAETSARNVRDAALIAHVSTRSKEVRELQSEFAKTKGAKQTLAEKPDNVDANLAMGKFKCFAKGDWDSGLPMLLKGNDDTLKALAEKDLAKPALAADMAALGDGWANYGDKQLGATKVRIHGRARDYYAKALPELLEPTKSKVEKRLAGLAGAAFATIDLLAMANPAKNAIAGTWKADGRAMVCSVAGTARIMLPYEVPDEYDYRVDFTRNGASSVALILTKGGREFVMETGWPSGQTGFAYINGQHIENNPTGTKFPLTNGRRYSFVVQVRNTGLKLIVDGKPIIEWKTDFKNLTPHSGWRLPNKQCLGIGSHECSTTFHTAELIEISGKGKHVK